MAVDWFVNIDGDNVSSLMQGDVVSDCPRSQPDLNELMEALREPHESEVSVSITWDIADVIVVTQSCDLEVRPDSGRCAVDHVLVAPVFSVADWRRVNNRDQWELLRKDRLSRFFLINHDPGEEGRGVVADFGKTFSVHEPVLRALAVAKPSRSRMQSPHREHFSQAFARFIMRVALPQ